jgi:hypothetical protein
MEALEFIYQDTEIHFLLGNEKNVMVNATEMAKAFGKEPKDFLRLDGTKNFIEKLILSETTKFAHAYLREQNKDIGADVPRYSKEDFVYSNNKAGTYMHRKLALKFAAWLDVDFELWIIDTIDDLLFGNAKKVGQKITDSERKKLDIAILTEKVKKLGNEDVNRLLLEIDELKKIESEKKKAMREFSNQYKMF